MLVQYESYLLRLTHSALIDPIPGTPRTTPRSCRFALLCRLRLSLFGIWGESAHPGLLVCRDDVLVCGDFVVLLDVLLVFRRLLDKRLQPSAVCLAKEHRVRGRSEPTERADGTRRRILPAHKRMSNTDGEGDRLLGYVNSAVWHTCGGRRMPVLRPRQTRIASGWS